MKIRTATAADGEDLAIRVYAGNGIAFYALIITFARLFASRNVFHVTPPFAMDLQPGSCTSIVAGKAGKRKIGGKRDGRHIEERQKDRND